MPEKPKRYRAAKAPAKIQSIEKHIERTYKLPTGSVQIRNRDGSNARGDQKVDTVRKQYE
jgi:hypothetical protein